MPPCTKPAYIMLQLLLSVCYYNLIAGDTTLYENDICQRDESYSWTCQKARYCHHFKEDLDRGTPPNLCGYNGSEPIVCCRVSPSEGWCSYYKNENFCPSFTIVAFGGKPSLAKEFPHMALIGYGNKEDISWQCGGSLISERYILSAAHCTFPSKQIGPARWVRLGDLDISIDTDDALPEDYLIIERINHPQYNPPHLYNDIALYKLDRQVKFSSYVRPICMHRNYTTSFSRGTATGWGRLEFVGPTSKHLIKVDLTLFSNSDCQTFIGQNSQLPNGVNMSSQFCAGHRDGSQDTCQGDSGGPFSVKLNRCLALQVGITSFGRQCGKPDSPGVYTRVAHFVPWIESIVLN